MKNNHQLHDRTTNYMVIDGMFAQCHQNKIHVNERFFYILFVTFSRGFLGLSIEFFRNYSLSCYISAETTFTDNLSV